MLSFKEWQYLLCHCMQRRTPSCSLHQHCLDISNSWLAWFSKRTFHCWLSKCFLSQIVQFVGKLSYCVELILIFPVFVNVWYLAWQDVDGLDTEIPRSISMFLRTFVASIEILIIIVWATPFAMMLLLPLLILYLVVLVRYLGRKPKSFMCSIVQFF